MKMQTLGFGALIGGLLTAPIVALMYLADKWIDLSFAPFDVFDWVARILPGPVVTFGIDLMIEGLRLFDLSVAGTAKTAEQIMAVLLFAVAGIAATVIVFIVVERRPRGSGMDLGLLIGALVGLPIAIIVANITQSSRDVTFSFLWMLLLFLGWGVASVASARRLLPIRAAAIAGPMEEEESETRSVEVVGRRQFLVRMGVATATVTVAGAGLGRVLAVDERQRLEAELEAMRADASTPTSIIDLPNADDPVQPALGTRPEYTAVRDHYKVFIKSQPTIIEEEGWTLPITGLVDNPLTLTLDDLRTRYKPRSEFVTLTCISNRVGGDLISTTHWTGARLQDILVDLQPQQDARYLFITSGDGFYEIVDLDLIASDERIMLAYNWDGRPIPFDHGFPLRIWIPDLYGMKQPKWITGIEVIDDYRAGYWVERGWSETARIKATSVIDTVAVDSIIENGDQKLIPIGGIAFGGARGISKVEVRLGEEDIWQEAQLRSPLSDTTWVIWRIDWPFEEGRHTFQVRCVEADGTPQIEEDVAPRPDGASGIHNKSEFI
jgi:DMSO/TMAO reductase YedYZ molybdopterin-dependent catalytic subunit